MLELLKIVVQPVLIERDEGGRITGEQVGEAAALYTAEQLDAFVKAIRADLSGNGNHADER
jgi:hypothetical protein